MQRHPLHASRVERAARHRPVDAARLDVATDVLLPELVICGRLVIRLVLVVVDQERLQVRVVAQGRERRSVGHAREGLDVVNVDVGKRHFFSVVAVPRAHFAGYKGPGVFARATHRLQCARALDAAGHGKAAARGTAEARPQIALRAALNANFAPPLVGAYSAPLALPAEALEPTVLTHGPSAVYRAGGESPHALAFPLLGW